MNERIVVAQTAGLRLANLAQPRIVKVTKPHDDQSISLDLSHDHSAAPPNGGYYVFVKTSENVF